MFVPDVSLFQRNVIKDVWRGFHRVTPSTAAPGPPESRSMRGSPPSKGGRCGLGRVYLPGHPAGSCITSATSSELVSLQRTVLPLHTTELRPRAATPLLSLMAVGKASYSVQAQECPAGLPFLCRSGKQDVVFIFSLSTKADRWSR